MSEDRCPDCGTATQPSPTLPILPVAVVGGDMVAIPIFMQPLGVALPLNRDTHPVCALPQAGPLLLLLCPNLNPGAVLETTDAGADRRCSN